MQTLLSKLTQERKWLLVPELTPDNGKRPDGPRLVGRVPYHSVEAVRLVREMAAQVDLLAARAG